MSDIPSTLSALDLRVHGDPVVVDLTDVQRQATAGGVISLCANKSGLMDKIIAADLGIDNATWSRWKSGQNAPSMEQLCALMDRCGNEAPLHWLLLARGYDPRRLHRIESEVERENRELRERLGALEQQREVEIALMQRLQGRVA